MNARFAVLLASLVSASALATGAGTPMLSSQTDGFTQLQDSRNLSQLIRSNTVHYWRYALGAKGAGRLGEYSSFEGMVVGDPHLGNFAVLPVRTTSGLRVMRFLNIDFDDAGRAPFAFDFARLVIAVKAMGGETKIKDLVDAYRRGLAGSEDAAPAYVRDALVTTMTNYDRQMDMYADSKTRSGRFVLNPGKIEAYSGPITAAMIEPLLEPGSRVLDLASRPRERGGNDTARVWAFVRNAQDQRRIVELKTYQPTATLNFESQSAPAALTASAYQVFWPGLIGADYRLVEIGQGELFWMRDKRIPLFDVPNLEAEFAAYVANHLGLAHGRQASAAGYISRINSNPDAFREAVKEVNREYLAIAEQAFTQR